MNSCPCNFTYYHSQIYCALPSNLVSFRCHTFPPAAILTYLLTPWSRVLLGKLTGSAASQEIPRIFVTRRFIIVLPILSQLHPVPTTPSHFLKTHLNIVLPSASGSPHWSLSLRFPHQNLVHPSPIHAACPAHLILLDFTTCTAPVHD